MNLSQLREQVSRLQGNERHQAEFILQQLVATYEGNPLQRFHACLGDCGEPGCTVHPKQHEFLSASTPVQAAFAGNRFGKTTALVVKCFIQHAPRESLPERLRPFKLTDRAPVIGRLLCPSFQVLESVNLPALREWAPRDLLLGGGFDKAWDKQHRTLRFADGGQLQVFTYEQDADKMGGAALDYVAYDEPPPQQVRRENVMRTADRNGFEMFAMTPVNIAGGGIGWVYREIWKRREAPYITVVQGSIHDNPVLPKDRVEQVLAEYADEERRAREFGEFVHIGGLVYSGGFEGVLIDPPSPKQLEGHDIVVGIDPGLKNAAFVWIAFDENNHAHVFDEVLIQEGTVVDYAQSIRQTNSKWGISQPLYVIDPSARNRSLTNAESVEAELNRQGIYPIHGQNAVEAGVQQIRRRMQQGAFFVSRECRGLRSEAEEYRLEDRPDGEFKVVKENDHRADATRYGCMSRPWYPTPDSKFQNLGWDLKSAPPQEWFDAHHTGQTGPMGPYS